MDAMDARYLIWLLTKCKVNLNQEANASLITEIVKAVKILRESVGGEQIEHGPQPTGPRPAGPETSGTHDGDGVSETTNGDTNGN